MRALRSYGQDDIRVEEVGEVTHSADEVIVDVEWCGICGSDLHLWHLGRYIFYISTSSPFQKACFLRLSIVSAFV